LSLKVTHRSTEQTGYNNVAEELDEQDPPSDEEDVDSTEGTDEPGKLIVIWNIFLQSFA